MILVNFNADYSANAIGKVEIPAAQIQKLEVYAAEGGTSFSADKVVLKCKATYDDGSTAIVPADYSIVGGASYGTLDGDNLIIGIIANKANISVKASYNGIESGVTTFVCSYRKTTTLLKSMFGTGTLQANAYDTSGNPMQYINAKSNDSKVGFLNISSLIDVRSGQIVKFSYNNAAHSSVWSKLRVAAVNEDGTMCDLVNKPSSTNQSMFTKFSYTTENNTGSSVAIGRYLEIDTRDAAEEVVNRNFTKIGLSVYLYDSSDAQKTNTFSSTYPEGDVTVEVYWP